MRAQSNSNTQHPTKISDRVFGKSTLIYTQLVSFEGDEYHVKVAKTVNEACELAKAGFDYFTTMDDAQIFRKRK